jgi:type IV pilus assembly protein PilC
MAKFQYKVKRGAEAVKIGTLEAESRSAAVAQLRDLGFFPISVEEFTGKEKNEKKKKEKAAGKVRANGAPRDTKAAMRAASLFGARRRVRLKDRNWFFRQLATLLQAGMPILRALATLRDQTPPGRLRTVIEGVHEAVLQGSSLADALEKRPDVFPTMYVSLVRAGEAGGMIEDVLWRIVTFGEQDEELRGKAFSAMIYPAFLTVVSSLAVFILVSFVFPNFVEVFKDFDAKLPVITLFVMAVSGFMGRFWWAVLLAVALLAMALRAYRRSPAGRRSLDVLWLKLPLISGLVQRYEMAKFARTLGTLFDNGVPVLTSLRITAETLGNTLIREEVERLQVGVSEGASISDGMRKAAHFPPLVVNIFAVGEESGRLGEVTRRLADAYDVEVDRAVKAVTALMEPVIIVVMGVIVGFLVISMLLPMLTLSAQVH